MSKLGRIIGGKKAKQVGKSFETAVIDRARHQGMYIIKMPEGCKRIPGPLKMIQVKTPFDFILFGDEEVVFLDAKTYAKNTIYPSDLVDHQVQTLLEIENRGYTAGYLIYLRTKDEVHFVSATILSGCMIHNRPIDFNKTLFIGNIFNFDLQAVTVFGGID